MGDPNHPVRGACGADGATATAGPMTDDPADAMAAMAAPALCVPSAFADGIRAWMDHE
jgi:hypothetical protein